MKMRTEEDIKQQDSTAHRGGKWGMKHLKLILIAVGCLFLIGLWVSDNYTFKTTPAHYDYGTDYKADLAIYDLTISDITPSGFNATFRTEKNQPLVVEWTVYPSDWFTVTYCGDKRHHSFTINTFPEGGTVVYRITNGTDWLPTHGTEWFYQDLPRPDHKVVIPPPYYKPCE